MRLIGWLLVVALVISAAQAIAVALYMALLVGVVVGLFAAPKETFGLLALSLIVGLIQAEPLAFLALVALMALARFIKR